MRAWTAGDALEPQVYVVTRADLIRYAAASGDFNPIHWSDRVASSVGLPGVIAHGMFTLALASRAVTSWVGNPDLVETFGARFTRPVPVPDSDEGTRLEVTGSVTSADADRATIELSVMHDGHKVLGKCQAVVRC